MHCSGTMCWALFLALGISTFPRGIAQSPETSIEPCDSPLIQQVRPIVGQAPAPAIALIMHNWIMSCPVYGMQVQQEIAFGLQAQWQRQDSVFVFFWEEAPPPSPDYINHLTERFLQLMERADFPPGAVHRWCLIP